MKRTKSLSEMGLSMDLELSDRQSECRLIMPDNQAEEPPNRKRVSIGKYKISTTGLLIMVTALFSIGVLIAAIILVVFTTHSISIDRAIFKEGAVASENPQCSTIGKETLLAGGSAVDATISSLLCVGLINSFSSGIGGGGFMVIRLPDGSSEVLDFRETAPAKAHKDMYKDHPEWSTTTGMSVAVPGEIAGFWEAHKKYGKLPWRDLFTPTIKLAREGYLVTKILAQRLGTIKDIVLADPNWKQVFAPNGTILKEGDTVIRPNLAYTLEQISLFGPDVFYRGWIGDNFVDFLKRNNGIMEKSDLENYKPIFRKTVSTYYRGAKVITAGPPTSGPIALQILNFLEGYDLNVGRETDLNIHRMIESFKHGFASRTELADPAFIDIADRVDTFIDKTYAALLRSNTSDFTTFDPRHYNPKYMTSESKGTTHISVVDKDQMSVACTSTVNLIFGSLLLDPVTGILPNNEMDDFSNPYRPNAFGLKPSPNNFIAPGKRPLSSMIPMIVEKDMKLRLIIGGSGGSRIPTATLQSLIYHLDFGYSLTAAVYHLRVHHQLHPNKISAEHGYHPQLSQGLVKRNHEMAFMEKNEYPSAVQGIAAVSEGYEAVSDFRKDGGPDGY